MIAINLPFAHNSCHTTGVFFILGRWQLPSTDADTEGTLKHQLLKNGSSDTYAFIHQSHKRAAHKLLILMRTSNGVESARHLWVPRGAQASNKHLSYLGQSEGQLEHVVARRHASLRKKGQRHRMGDAKSFHSHTQWRKSAFLSWQLTGPRWWQSWRQTPQLAILSPEYMGNLSWCWQGPEGRDARGGSFSFLGPAYMHKCMVHWNAYQWHPSDFRLFFREHFIFLLNQGMRRNGKAPLSQPTTSKNKSSSQKG